LDRVRSPFPASVEAVGPDDLLLHTVARPAGDLVQAGPLLVAGGVVVFDGREDREGFSAGAGQFDSDITEGRYPRAALGISEESIVAVACDGRRSNARSTSTAVGPPLSSIGGTS
jgi:Phosphodiester glycosidase